MIGNATLVALQAAAAFEEAGVEYLVGGSMASSMAGEPRSTMDIDFVIELTEAQVPLLVAALGDDFHADSKSIVRAVRERSSANVFHAPTSLKLDLFVLGPTPFERGQMRRRRRVRVASSPDRFLYTYTPEDIVLQKLRWYRMGNEVSDRQWRDVLSILRISGATLDPVYLREGASAFGVTDLLARAVADVEAER